MPSRRSHTKSRKGCLECKRRHVKCDEGIPKCSLCRKRKLQCTYPPPPNDNESHNSSTTPQDASDQAIGSPHLPSSARLLEMRLFHHYLTETYSTLPERSFDAHYFQKILPRMAVSHPYLLDAIFAVSGFHLASLETDDADSQSWLEAGLKYQTQACSVFSRVIMDITAENCGPAFFCSVLIMVCATAYPSAARGDHPFDALSHLLEIRRLLTGCALLMSHLGSTDQGEKLKAWIPKDENKIEQMELSVNDRTSKLFSLRGSLLESLNNIRTKIESDSSPHQKDYYETWALLHEVIEKWPLGGNKGGIISWPIHISDAYISLLQEGDWMARILFLHYGVGMHLRSEKWFVNDWARRFVHSVMKQVEEVPPEWANTVAWFKEVVESG